MDFDPRDLIKLLSTHLNTNEHKNCEILLEKLQAFFNEEIPEGAVDVYITSILSQNTGLLWFIEQAHRRVNAKVYQKTCSAAFKVLYLVVNNFPHNVEKHANYISRGCLATAFSLSTSSDEKDQALKVLMLLLEKQLFSGDIDDVVQIYTKLFKPQMLSSTGTTVSAKIMEIFGLISKTFPMAIHNPDELLQYALNLLKRSCQQNSKQLIAGCLSMLRNFFINFAPPLGSSELQDVYQHVKGMADPTYEVRKVANRDAILLLQTHSTLFAEQMFRDRNWWHNVLLKYLTLGLEEKKVGSVALESFYKEVADKFKESPGDCSKNDASEYLSFFTATMNDTSKNNFQIRTAIRGIGIFSEAFKVQFPPNEILKLFIDIVQKVEHDYVITEPDYDILSFLPVYIQTIGSLMEALDVITDSQVLCFQKLLVFMVKTFPKLSRLHHETVIQVFVKMLYQIQRCKTDANHSIAVVVRHSVIWSCSHPYPLDSDQLEGDEEKTQATNFRSYLPLWKGLLSAMNSKKFNWQSQVECQTATTFFDELIKTLLYLINKLNLEVKLKDDPSFQSNPGAAYDVVQINDYEIYLNVVDFYQKLLEDVDTGLFERWLKMLTNQLLMKSLKYPLNSGFYKLLSSALRICEELSYFSEREQKEDVQTCFESMQAFIKDMLLKMRQFSGDLQIACLQLLLQAPCELISDLLPFAVPAFHSLFAIGRSYFDLIHMSLETLTRWKNNLPEEDMNVFLKQVIPALDSYLRSKSLENTKTKPIAKTRKTKQVLSKVKILVETEPGLFKLQKAILTFISQLGSDLCYVFVDANSCVDPGNCSQSKHLKIALPYDDGALAIHLDPLLPRILQLALYCSNRKIRMTACELLHSLVMVFLGATRKKDLARILELDAICSKLIGAVLQLGCALDEPIQKLFEPLVLALVHWYTHPLQVRSSQTEILINALMDGITQPDDPALRDFCGKCVKELTVWTIKHMDSAKDASNVKVLVKRITFYSLHSDTSKKLGAALIFNSIYTVLREEDALFNKYWIEILYAFVKSLAMIEAEFSEDVCFLEQVDLALTRVQRGFVEKSARFNKYDSDRRLPPHFEGSKLKDVADFLLKHTRSKNPHCRAKCMQLFCEVRPLIEKCDSCGEKTECLHVPDLMQDLYQADLVEKPLQDSAEKLFEWLYEFHRALDGYLFILKNRFVQQTSVLKSNIFLSALVYFLNHVAQKSIKTLAPKSSCTVTEKECFNKVKLQIVLKAIDFVVVLLEIDTEHVLKELWENCLPGLVCHVVFDPQSLGMERSDINNSHKQCALTLLDAAKRKLPQNLIVNVEDAVSSFIIRAQLAPSNFKKNVPLKQRLLIKGIMLLHESEFSTRINLPDTVAQIFESLYRKEGQMCVVDALDDTYRGYYDSLLQLAFFNEDEKKKLVRYFFDETPLNVLNQSKTTTCGKHFFELFRETVTQNFLNDFALFLNISLEQKKINMTVDYITAFLVYIEDNRSKLQNRAIKSACEQILTNWSQVQSFFEENFTNLQRGVDFIKKLARAVPFPVYWIGKPKYGIADWIIGLLMKEHSDLPFEIVFDFRTQIYDLFPVISGMSDEENIALRNALKFLKSSYYETKTQLTDQNIILSLNKMLDSLKASSSRITLEGFSEIYGASVVETKSLDLENTLLIYISQIDSDLQLKTVEMIYELSLGNDSLVGHKIASNILSCLLQNCNKTVLEKFTKNHISNIVSAIKTPTAQVIEKIVAFIVIEIVFFAIDFTKFDPTCREIVRIALYTDSDSAQDLIKLIANQAAQTAKEQVRGCPELFRLYQCQSYKALASVVANTKRELKPYSLLFAREVVWNCLVDPEKHYSFEPTFENAIPTYRNRFVNIRNEVRTLKRSRGMYTATVNYSESQISLLNSTLSEDISKFDFTNTVLRKTGEAEGASEQENVMRQDVALESIEINNHECMATICGLIEFMVENDISPLPEQSGDVPPDWMKGILKVLVSGTTHNNAKLLLTKVIHNTQDVFKPYAKHFLPEIARLICEECFGSEINYFVYDLVSMFLEWSKMLHLLQEEAEICSQLLTFLMKNVDNDVPAIYKMNRELIRTVIEIWKPVLKIPHEFLFEKLKLPADSKQLASGVDLVHDVLLNKLEAWNMSQKREFLTALCQISIRNENRRVYQEAAKAIGLALALLESKPDTAKDAVKLFALIKPHLTKIKDENRFLYCFEGIASNYPRIADSFCLCKLISSLNTAQGTFKNMILKILSASCVQLQNVSEFSFLDYEKLLLDPDADVQILTLELAKNYLEYYSIPDLLRVLNIVVKVVNNRNITCREIMYEILIKCLSNCTINEEIRKLCKDTVIEGLSDQNLDIQEKVFQYCSSQDLPKEPQDRMVALLKGYYNPAKEPDYLGHVVYLLFDVLQKSAAYRSLLFDEPLYQCTLEEYKLYGHWRAQHSSLVPMFADTLRSQMSQQQSLHFTSANFNVVRATQQSLAFQPTQASFSTDGGEEFKDPNKLLLSDKYRKSKYRFFKDRDRVSRHFAHQEVKKASKREQARRDLAKQKERGVTFYRQYKRGDFPDIQIEYKDVLLPLQVLAKYDPEIAKTLFSVILQSIMKEADNSDALIADVTEAANKIFNTSFQFNPTMMGAFLDLAAEHKDTIKFQPELIFSVCQSSGLASTGIALFEEYLLSDPEVGEPSSKRQSGGAENDCWIYLSELYKEVGEFDAVKGILLEKLNCSEQHLQAIKAETSGDWKEALEAYEELITNDADLQYRKELYYESYFKCFASLADWENLSRNIEASVRDGEESDPWSELWDQDWNQKKIMPWYLKSEVKKILIGSGDVNNLLMNLNKCLQDNDRYEYLRTHFSEELAMLWLVTGNEEEAKIYLKTSISQFLDKWTGLSTLFSKWRFIKLLNLRNVVDVDLFVRELSTLSPVNFDETTRTLKKTFLKAAMDEAADLQIFESRILYHLRFLDLLTDKLKNIMYFEIESEEIARDLNVIKYQLNKSLIDAALKQNNFYVARKYFVRQEQVTAPSDLSLNLLMTSKIGFLKAKSCVNATKSDLLLNCWDQIGPILSDETVELQLKISASQHLFNITKELATCAPELDALKIRTGFSLADVASVALYGAQQLKTTADAAYTTTFEQAVVTRLVAKAYVDIAYFAQKTATDLKEVLISSVLRSMKLGSLEGVQIFPCILNINGLETMYRGLFISEAKDVPVWMFLRWIPQLLVNIDTEKIFAVSAIVERIAIHYPQSMMYAYRLSKENYSSETENAEKDRLIKRLDELLLRDEFVDLFLKALSSVTMPENILSDHLKKLLQTIGESKSEFNRLVDSVVEAAYGEKYDSGDVTKFRGNAYKSIAGYRKNVESLRKEKTAKRRSAIISDLIKRLKNLSRGSKNLKDYSPWLAHLHPMEFNCTLEIPGQYTGMRKPLPQYHAKIAGFAPKVTLLTSLRKPIKLTILGHDTKEYSYLVKFGEDLRQDQRIEQLFCLMNDIFQNDYESSLHHLSLATYQVVPLTNNLGIIEWVEDSEVFKKIFDSQLESKNAAQAANKAMKDYLTFLDKKKGLLHKCSRDEIIPFFQALVHCIPSDFLRSTIREISTDLESFTALKTNFIKSYAVTCAAHWLLGIGDRHLDNSMLSLKNCKAIGIDFGHAFGTATQILPIPELVPFRLTACIENLLEPMGKGGLYKEMMVKALKAFRRNSDALLTTMEVFVKEPSLEWKQYAGQFETVHGFSKVVQTKMKLEGINPVECAIQDVKANSRTNARDDYIALARGDAQFDVRARKGNDLSVEDQVDCLLDLATDRNLLARIYVGYTPWV